jgi:hypothetical protein
MRKVKMFVATTFSTALLAAGVAVPTAGAQQQGLVNVDIHNVLNNNNISVAIPINAAANICGVSVVVLAQDLAGGPVTCRSGANQTFTVRQLQ